MSLLDRRVRGFRLVDVVALGLLTSLILGVYLAKTIAGRERAEIAQVERQIDSEKARIRLLQAEVSHLEQPSRIEHLSETYLGLGPVSIKHEAAPEDLGQVAGKVPARTNGPVITIAPPEEPAAIATPAPALDVAVVTQVATAPRALPGAPQAATFVEGPQ